MKYKYPCFFITIMILLLCFLSTGCSLPPDTENNPHTLEVTGLPTPKSGEDPYADLDGADRAAAFLKNADMMSYEFTPLLMHGQYVIPTMAATPITHNNGEQTFTINHLPTILEQLHSFDLTSLSPIDVASFDRQNQISSLIHAGDARCRMAIWYDKAKRTSEQEIINSALVFTFADGTMCGFDGGNSNSLVTDLYNAIGQSGSARTYAFNTNITAESNVTVTEVATGESRVLPPFAAAYVECIFENTPLLSEQVKSEADFPWQIEIQNGGCYWYNAEQNLLMTESNKVYAISGFENQEDNLITMEALVSRLVTDGFDAS